MVNTCRLLLFAVILMLVAGESAAITYQGAVTDRGNDDNASLTVPGSVLTDDLLLVQVTIRDRNGSDGVTTPTGWTQIGVQARDDDVLQSLYYRVATAGEAGNSYNWDFDGNGNRRYILGMTVFRAVDTSNPIAANSSATGMSGSVVSAPSVTTTNADSMLVGFYTIEAGNQSFSPPAGMTEAYDEEENNTNNGLTTMAAYQVQAAAGATGTRNATSTRSNDDAIGALVALNPAIVITTPPVLLADWRFDETSWNGTSGEVVDSSGNNNNGQAINALPTNGLLCNAADLSVNSNSDYLTMNANALNGQSDFTISVWGRTSQSTTFAAILSGAAGNSGLLANELFMLFDGDSEFRPGISDEFFSDPPPISTPNIADGQWHHFVWTRTAATRQSCLYMDGTLLGCVTNPNTDDSAPLTIASGGLIIGQDQDNIGGSFDANQDWEGLLDEMLIFDSALSASQISDIRSNQLAGNNWDGSIRTCPVVTPTPLAEWRFDEASWNNSPNEVIDSSGNNNHGQAVNVSPVSGLVCNAADLSTSSNNDYLSMNSNALNGQSDFSISVWGRTSQATSFAAVLSGAAGNSGLLANELFMLFDGTTAFRPGISDQLFSGPPSITTPNIADDQWHHFVWTRTAATRQSCLYMDGTLLGCVTNPNTDDGDPLTIASGGLIIGQDQDNIGGGFDANQDWEGLLDEMVIFDSVLSTSQINDIRTNQLAGNGWDGSARSCLPTGPDHYSVTAPANNVSCLPLNVTIEAHDNAHGVVSSESNTITIRTSTNIGSWSGTGVTDQGSGSATVALNSSTAANTVQLHYPVVGSNITLSIDGSGNDDATINVSLSGFRFGVGNDATFDTTLPNQVAGVADTRVRLQAIRTGDTGECEALYNNQTRTVGFAASYINPDEGAGISPSINNTAINSYNNSVAISTYSYTDVAVTFDSESIATLDFNYNDVGQLQLHAQDTATLSGGTTSQLNGSSDNFVVRPDHFAITASGNIPAGTNFNVTVTAQRSGGGTTPNYGNESSPEGVAVSFNSLVLPVGGSNGALTTSTLFIGGNGVFSGALSWTEVGTITLIADVADSDYLGAGAAFNPTPSGNIGRFYPADFVFGSDSVQNSCGSFSYLSHPAISAAYTLTARNTSGGTTTNYDADSDDTPGTTNYPVRSITHQAMQGSTNLTSRLVVATGASWDDGVYTVNTTDVAINRNSNVEGPFNSVQLSAVINTGPDPITVPSDTDIGNPLMLRFGRARISSVHGPESAFLNVPFGTEFWNGSQFVPSVSDSCTAIAVSQIQFDGTPVSSNPENVDFGTGTTDGTFFFTNPNATTAGGSFGLVFSPPGAGNTGSFPINVNLTNYPWLRFDWNQDNSHDDTNLPEATISFGSYRGHDRVIYWRERFD